MRTEPHSQSLHEGTSMTWLRKVRSMPPSKKPRRFSKSRRSAARSQAGLVPADQRFLCAGACINLILALFLLVIVNGSALFVDGRDEATAKWNVATVCAGAVVLCLAIAFVDFRLWSLFTEEARKYISPAAGMSPVVFSIMCACVHCPAGLVASHRLFDQTSEGAACSST